MKVKLDEIFVPVVGKTSYSIEELRALNLRPDFVSKLATRFNLSFVEHTATDTNLCFAENDEVAPEYKTSFNKAQIQEVVLSQLFTNTVSLLQTEIEFPNDGASFFSKSFTNLLRIKAHKKHLRQVMLERRNNMPRKKRNLLAKKICEELWNLIQEKDVRVVHSYLTMGSEVNVLPLLQKALDKGLTVVVPKTLKKRQMQNLILTNLKNMEEGIFNTYHPKDAVEYTGQYDLIIVAGLAFDNDGFRVGYGGGYYDTFLAPLEGAMKIGVCYPFQIMERVPVEAHDVQLDQVIY